MKKLLSGPAAYDTPAERSSGHNIGASFGKDGGGATPPNLLQIPNSEAGGHYLNACCRAGVNGHPARFPARLPEFFIRILTGPGNLVPDILGGSNTTGRVAQTEGQARLTFEQSAECLAASALRFIEKSVTAPSLENMFFRYTCPVRGPMSRSRAISLLVRPVAVRCGLASPLDPSPVSLYPACMSRASCTTMTP